MNQQLVEQFMPFANKLAHAQKKVLPNYIEFEELQSAAYLGLVEAANRYDEAYGSFMTFAYPRISGAIKDYLRSLRSNINMSDHDLSEIASAKQDRTAQTAELFEFLTYSLGENARNMLKSYYLDDLSMVQVGDLFGITEGRVSQLISGYKAKIKNRLENEVMEMMAA